MTKKACNKENMLKFIAYLESGKFKQGNGKLRPTNRTYCCLGVAEKCRMANKGKGPQRWTRSSNGFLGVLSTGNPGFKNETGILSIPGMDWLGIDERNPNLYIPDSLLNKTSEYSYVGAAQLNDNSRLSFEEIAKCFRHTYIEDVE